MIRIVVDRAQSGGDLIKIVDADDTILASKRLNDLPEKDDNQLWQIGLEIVEYQN
jgi:hypothetical protein